MKTTPALLAVSLLVGGWAGARPATAQPQAFVLKGQLTVPQQAVKVYLCYLTPAGAATYDSTWVRRGHFEFSGRVTQPLNALLVVGRPGQRQSYPPRAAYSSLVYLERGTIYLTSADSLENAVARGTPLNDDHARVQAIDDAFANQLLPLQQRLQAAWPATAPPPDTIAKLNAIHAAALASYDAALRQFINDHPASLVSLEALESLDSSTPDLALLEPLYQGLAPEVRASREGQKYARELDAIRPVSVGATAPDFGQSDPAGRAVSLSDFRGQYVLLDFWASWCGPCRQENPNLVSAYHRFRSRNFTVLSVSLDRSTGRSAWLKAIAADGLPWPQVSDLQYWDNAAARLYQITAIPQNFLIGPDGKILARNLRGDALGRQLDALLPPPAAGK